MQSASHGPAEAGDAAKNARRDRRKRTFPQPVAILVVLLVLVWIATFLIPSGQYALDASGSPIAGSFRYVPSPIDPGARVRDLLLAPINGMYGVRDAATGMIGPTNRGKLFGSVDVFLFILSIGGFMSVVFATGALELGVHHLAFRSRERAALLVAILTALFCVLGSVKGWSDESLGLYAIMVPLMIALGYDRLVAVAVLTVAPFCRRRRGNDQPVQYRDRGVEIRRFHRRSSGPSPRAARAQRRRDGSLHALVREAGKDRTE